MYVMAIPRKMGLPCAQTNRGLNSALGRGLPEDTPTTWVGFD